MKKTLCRWTAIITLVSATAGFARAEEWQWSITPYAWLAGMDGDTGIPPLVASVDKSPSDIISNLDWGAMLTLDGNNGTWGALGDFFYVRLINSQDTAIGKVRGDVEQYMVNIAPYYRAWANEKVALDLGVGARGLYTDIDVSIPAGSGSDSTGWIDPILLARVQVPLGEKFSLRFTGDIGGFGVGTDLTWQALAGAGYTFNERLTGLLAYRYIYFDYEDDDFVFDVAMSGLALGLQISF